MRALNFQRSLMIKGRDTGGKPGSTGKFRSGPAVTPVVTCAGTSCSGSGCSMAAGRCIRLMVDCADRNSNNASRSRRRVQSPP
eukprot:COSAG05_NODE_3052_length_2381_cov_3.333041_1_plen_83_part_00